LPTFIGLPILTRFKNKAKSQLIVIVDNENRYLVARRLTFKLVYQEGVYGDIYWLMIKLPQNA